MIKIYTFADKRPDFIILQNKLFKKFIEDDYEFIVINAASSNELKENINFVCEKLNLQCLNFPVLNHFSPQPACSKPIQWCWDNYISKDNKNISFIIDSDMFLVGAFNVEKYLNNNDICADYDKRLHVNYIWNGLMIFSPNLKNKNEMNFSEGVVDGVVTDVGGNLYYYIKKYNPKIKHIENIGYIHKDNKNTHLLPVNIQEIYEDSYLCEFFEQKFFHYRAGSNWNNKNTEYHNKKTQMLKKLIDDAINDRLVIPPVNGYKFHEIDNWWSIYWNQNLSEFSRYINGQWNNK